MLARALDICSLDARFKDKRGCHARTRGRHRAQKRTGAGDNHHVAACGQRVRSLHTAGAYLGLRRRLLCRLRLHAEGIAFTLGKAQHALVAQIGGNVARKGNRSVFTRDNYQRGLRPMGKTRGDHERPRR